MDKNKKKSLINFLKWLGAGFLAFFGLRQVIVKRKEIKKTAIKLKSEAAKQADKLEEELEKVQEKFSQKLKHLLKDYFLPHDGNDHKPKALRPKALTVYVGTILAVKIIVTATLFFVYPNQATLTSKIIDNLYRLTNEERVANGLEPLSINPELAAAAQRKVDDMAAKNYFAHVSPEGKYPWQMIDTSNYQFSYMGENLAMDFSSAEVVHSAFMNSPSHRDNILHSKYKDIGIALKVGNINGKETIILAEFFATPKFTSTLAVATNPPQTSQVSETNTVEEEESPSEPVPAESVITETEPVVEEELIEPAEEQVPSKTVETLGVNNENNNTIASANNTESQTDREVKQTEEVFEFNGVPLNIAGDEEENDIGTKGNPAENKSDAVGKKLASLDNLPGAQLVVVDQPDLKPGLVDLLVSWSRNFMTLMLIIISALLMVNILIKTRIQHTHVIVHSLIAIALITAMLLVRFHTVERFIF